MDQFIHQSALIRVSGNPLDLTISYRRSKPFLIFLVIAFFALKPLLLAGRASDQYLRVAGLLIFVLSIYAGLALSLDRTTIRALGKQLTLRHGPLPLLFGAKFIYSDIKLFHCDERRFRAAHYYKLEAELVNGSRTKILSPVPEVDDAQYVFMALSRWLEAARGLT